MNVHDFKRMKMEKRKISMVTCYDAWSAKIIESSEADCVLVGDSVSMVVHGYPSTVHATTAMMVAHTQAVARGFGSKPKFLVGDMPFLSYRRGTREALDCVDQLMKAGASSVKLEGIWGHEEVVHQIVGSGVPVMGHIGLTPQSIHGLGGFKVQGRDEGTARDLVKQALRLQELGCFALVLECVPTNLAQEITQGLDIPTIGIGAGPVTDGQVLVLQDLLGMSPDFKPKFLKQYMDGHGALLGALNLFHKEVAEGRFPSSEQSYQ